MAIYDVTVPQMGEGLREARLLRFLKAPLQEIARDEAIFEMETDKATMEIESPVAGRLIEWVTHEEAVVPVGSVVARIEVDDELAESLGLSARAALDRGAGAQTEPKPPPTIRNAVLPPRTRAYAREKGVTDEELAALASHHSGKLLPDHIDAWLAGRSAAEQAGAPETDAYEDVAPSVAQRTLVFRLQQRAREAVPATEEIAVSWSGIDALRMRLKAAARAGGPPAPTPFLIFAWCVAHATREHARFRSVYVGDGARREYPHVHLGIAVTLGDDELITARVDRADTMVLADFVAAATDAVKRARAGEDQSNESMQLVLSNLAGAGIERGIPVIVPPAVGTMFLGRVYDRPVRSGEGMVWRRTAQVALTFDHRVVNGAGAARFLDAVRRQVEEVAMGGGVVP